MRSDDPAVVGGENAVRDLAVHLQGVKGKAAAREVAEVEREALNEGLHGKKREHGAGDARVHLLQGAVLHFGVDRAAYGADSWRPGGAFPGKLGRGRAVAVGKRLRPAEFVQKSPAVVDLKGGGKARGVAAVHFLPVARARQGTARILHREGLDGPAAAEVGEPVDGGKLRGAEMHLAEAEVVCLEVDRGKKRLGRVGKR